MSRVERLARGVDDFQQRHRPVAFLYATAPGSPTASATGTNWLVYGTVSMLVVLLGLALYLLGRRPPHVSR